MPELPEVETIKRDLALKLKGLSFQSVTVYDERVLQVSKNVFKKKLTGLTVMNVTRRAKALILEFHNGHYLVVQLKMTGQLIYDEHFKETGIIRDTKVVFELSNGRHLLYNDQRTFGWLIYATQLEEVKYFKSLGPEPLEGQFTAAFLSAQLKRRKSPIKTLLMNQQFVAGIGNIYASEILFKAGIRPQRPSDRIKKKEIEPLYRSTVAILEEAIQLRGSSMRNYRDASGAKGAFNNRIKVYARENEPCPACKTLIKKIVQAGRSTFYCPHCQN